MKKMEILEGLRNAVKEHDAESPPGPVKVQIHYDNPRELIEWLAPKTVS